MFWPGFASQNCQRMTSAPIESSASSEAMALPQERCISRPCSSRSFSYVRTALYGDLPTSVIDMNEIE